jgi:TRAP-type C4-dicarboxylate transport system substrate-binding protein
MKQNAKSAFRLRWSHHFGPICPRWQVMLSLLAVCLAPIFSHAASAQEKTQLTYRYATAFGPTDETYQDGAEWMRRVTEKVEKQTKYTIKFKVFAQSSLIKLNDMVAGIQDGRVDMGVVAPSLFPSQLPISQVVSIPFLSEDAPATLKTNMALARDNPVSAAEWTKLGIVPVLYGPAENAATSFKLPVKDIAELKGKRIRAIGLHAEALKAAGASPVAIPTSEVYQAMQTGVIDGYSGTPMGNQITGQRIQEVAKHFVDLGLGQFTSAVVVAVRKSTWDAIPPEVQDIMIQTSDEIVNEFIPRNLGHLDALACDAVKAVGGSVVRVPDDQIATWKSQVYDSTVDKYVANASKGSGADPAAIKDFLTAYQADLKKYATPTSVYEDGMTACRKKL